MTPNQEKIKKGQFWKSKDGGFVIEITGKHSGNRHWNTRKVSKSESHHIHEGTLIKFYEKII